jgi:hypothetical protein
VRIVISLTAGSIIAAWLCYGLRIHLPTSQWGWRVPTLLMSFFAFLMICLFPFVPESPRFMIAKGRDAEAHALLAKWHANGVMDDELVAAELLEIKETFATENASKGQSKSWRQCFATPGDRWRMFICVGLATCNNWTGQSIVSYYNTQILTQAGITATLPQLGINGGLSIFDFFCAVFGGFISGRTSPPLPGVVHWHDRGARDRDRTVCKVRHVPHRIVWVRGDRVHLDRVGILQ